jgi:hypothetical protein
MRVRFSTWCALGSVLVLQVGCGGDDKGNEPVEDASTGADTSASRADAGAARADAAGPSGASGANPDAGTTVTTIAAVTAPAACSGPLSAATALFCPLPDPYEPNDGDRVTLLEVDPTCTIAEANLTQGDTDAYRFEATLSEPVLVELDYPKRGDTALQFNVGMLTGGNVSLGVTSSDDGPLQAQMSASAYFVATKGATYDVSVKGKLGELCQPYTLRVNPRYCTDDFEDNDTDDRAARLDLGPDGTRELQATVHGRDEDYYRFTMPKADPFLITGTYTVDADSPVSVRVLDEDGLSTGAVEGARNGTTETLSGWITAKRAGEDYRVRVLRNTEGSACAPYTLKVDTAACTDTFEDNDALTTPAALQLGSDQQATAFKDDLDHYDVSALASGGSCVLTFATVAGGQGGLSAQLYDGKGAAIANGERATMGSNETITLAWAAVDAKTLRVSSSDDVCQPYTVRCAAPVAPAQ